MLKSAEREVLSKMHTTCKIKILLLCAVYGMPQQESKRRSGPIVFEFVTIFKGWSAYENRYWTATYTWDICFTVTHTQSHTHPNKPIPNVEQDYDHLGLFLWWLAFALASSSSKGGHSLWNAYRVQNHYERRRLSPPVIVYLGGGGGRGRPEKPDVIQTPLCSQGWLIPANDESII